MFSLTWSRCFGCCWRSFHVSMWAITLAVTTAGNILSWLEKLVATWLNAHSRLIFLRFPHFFWKVLVIFLRVQRPRWTEGVKVHRNVGWHKVEKRRAKLIFHFSLLIFSLVWHFSSSSSSTISVNGATSLHRPRWDAGDSSKDSHHASSTQLPPQRCQPSQFTQRHHPSQFIQFTQH